MKINPSSTSTALDYGENPNKSSDDQGKGTQQGEDEYQPKVPHEEEGGPESARNLRSRKTTKKSKKKRSKSPKLAERRARQKKEEEEEQEDEDDTELRCRQY